MILTGETELFLEKTCPSDNLCTTNSTRPDLELNLGLQSEITTSHCLSHGRSTLFCPFL